MAAIDYEDVLEVDSKTFSLLGFCTRIVAKPTVLFPIPIKVTRCPYGSSSNVGTSEHEGILKVDFQMSHELGLRTRVVTSLPYIFQSLLKLFQCRRSFQSNVGTIDPGGIFEVYLKELCILGVCTPIMLCYRTFFQSLWKLLDIPIVSERTSDRLIMKMSSKWTPKCPLYLGFALV